MEMERDKVTVTVAYRGKMYAAEVPVAATVGELGEQMSRLTGVALPTMRLLVPQGRRTAAAAILPASEPHSSMTIKNSGIAAGQVIRMMGALVEEIEQLSQPANKRAEDRILGFAEEDRRAKQRASASRGPSRPLPSGPYTFTQFRTLQLPGVELNPPAPQALAIMHKLASDPGIVAIMKKHRWQVGVMTELAPVGYVGISPKCILGFNKNRGEEISLRLRTDDLRGFRKYESIKKTLLHELAHMVHDEHDEKFHALDKQLNQEASALDWTRLTAHTVSGARPVEEDDDAPMDFGGIQSGHKLGGSSIAARDTRTAAVEAALLRMERNRREVANDAIQVADPSAGKAEPDPDELVDPMDYEIATGPSPLGLQGYNEPDPDDVAAAVVVIAEGQATADDVNGSVAIQNGRGEPDPDDAAQSNKGPSPDESPQVEPDPDEALAHVHNTQKPHTNKGPLANTQEPDPDEGLVNATSSQEPDPDEAHAQARDPGEALASSVGAPPDSVEMDLGIADDELARIHDAAAAATARLQKAIATLKQQASAAETTAAIQTLFTILRNVMDHPNESKYRRLRKANPTFQHRVAKYEGAVEVLRVVGFADGGGSDCLVLKSTDPGLLWLARSSLEASLA